MPWPSRAGARPARRKCARCASKPSISILHRSYLHDDEGGCSGERRRSSERDGGDRHSGLFLLPCEVIGARGARLQALPCLQIMRVAPSAARAACCREETLSLATWLCEALPILFLSEDEMENRGLRWHCWSPRRQGISPCCKPWPNGPGGENDVNRFPPEFRPAISRFLLSRAHCRFVSYDTLHHLAAPAEANGVFAGTDVAPRVVGQENSHATSTYIAIPTTSLLLV